MRRVFVPSRGHPPRAVSAGHKETETLMTKKVVPLKWEGGEEIGTAVVSPDGRAELIIWPGVRPEILEAIMPDLEHLSIGFTPEPKLPTNPMNDQLPETLRPKFRPPKESA